MARTKNWTFAMNTVPTDQSTLQQQSRSFFVQLKEVCLKPAGWTVVSASDGTTFSASDIIGTDLTKVNHNTSAAARSHYTVRSPIGYQPGADGTGLGDQSRVWLTVEAVASAATNYYMINFRWHREAPTGGSTTVCPSSTDVGTYTTTGNQFLKSPLSASKFHFSYTDTGHFVILLSADGSGRNFARMESPPYESYGQYAGKDFPYPAIFNFYYLDSPAGGHLGYTYGSTYTKGWNMDGTANTAITVAVYAIMINTSATLNTIGSNETLTGDFNGNVSMSKMHIHSNTAGKMGYMGTIADRFATNNVSKNFGDVTGDPIEYVYGYAMFYPTNVVLSL